MVILAYSIWFLSMLPTGISCFSQENDDIKQTNKIVDSTAFIFSKPDLLLEFRKNNLQM